MELHMEERKKMLEQAGVQEEVIKFLSEQEEVPLIYEWSFLCAMDGMPAEEMQRICKEAGKQRSQASELFMSERRAFLKKLYENNKELSALYTDLLRRVEIMYERTSALEEGLSGRLKEAMQDKDKVFAQMLETKDMVIRDREKQMLNLKEEVPELKKEIAELKKEAAGLKGENRELVKENTGLKKQVYSLEDKLRTAEVRLSSMERKDTQADAGRTPDMSSGQKTSQTRTADPGADVEEIHVIPYNRLTYSMGAQRKRRGFFRKEDRTAEEFIRLYVENDDYSEEQKEYLIKCLEQGDPLDVIKEFASPSLSVANMDWLRRITYRRRR